MTMRSCQTSRVPRLQAPRISEWTDFGWKLGLPDSERYRQAELGVMAEFGEWQGRVLDRVQPEILRTRWPDDDVIFVRHSCPTKGG